MTTSFRVRLVAFAVLVASSLALGTQPSAQSAPYRILISNDDGVRAPGILALALALGRSGRSRSPRRRRTRAARATRSPSAIRSTWTSVTLAPGLEAYSITATPASCVKVGVGALMPRQAGPRRVRHQSRLQPRTRHLRFGHRRRRARSGADGIPAIAASTGDRADATTRPAAKIVRQVVEMVRKNGPRAGAFLNVNVPPGTAAAIKGIQLTRQSQLTGVERFEEQKIARPAGASSGASGTSRPATSRALTCGRSSTATRQ